MHNAWAVKFVFCSHIQDEFRFLFLIAWLLNLPASGPSGDAFVFEAGGLRFKFLITQNWTQHCQRLATAATFHRKELYCPKSQWRGDGSSKLAKRFSVIRRVKWKIFDFDFIWILSLCDWPFLNWFYGNSNIGNDKYLKHCLSKRNFYLCLQINKSKLNFVENVIKKLQI